MDSFDFSIDGEEDHVTMGSIDKEIRGLVKVFSPILQIVEFRCFNEEDQVNI